MRRVVRLTQLLLLSGAFLGPSVAHATLSAHLQRGEKIVDLSVAGRNAEVCVIPKHFVGGEYSDKDIEVETKLCNIDVNTNAAVCPKLNSTNPGLDFYSLPQSVARDDVAARCETSGAKKIAKCKLSTSCSYTPSILGYYHMAQESPQAKFVLRSSASEPQSFDAPQLLSNCNTHLIFSVKMPNRLIHYQQISIGSL